MINATSRNPQSNSTSQSNGKPQSNSDLQNGSSSQNNSDPQYNSNLQGDKPVSLRQASSRQQISPLTTEAVFAINAFYEETNMIYHDIAKKRGLSDSAFDILYALYVEDGQRLSQLCKTSFLSKQTLSSSVKRLEEEGLLRTERQNSRFVQVFLTDAGWERARNFVEPVFEAEVRAVASLTEKEQAALPRFVEHYLGALRKEFAALEDAKNQ